MNEFITLTVPTVTDYGTFSSHLAALLLRVKTEKAPVGVCGGVLAVTLSSICSSAFGLIWILFFVKMSSFIYYKI